MTATETVLDIVVILRECRVCGVLKPLEHFLVLIWTGKVKESVKVCAACRGNVQPSVAAKRVKA